MRKRDDTALMNTTNIHNSIRKSLSPPVLYSQPLPEDPDSRDISSSSSSNCTSLTSIIRVSQVNQ